MTGIYKFENLINHKVYIGQSVDIEKRYAAHLRRYSTEDTVFYRAIRKYGIDNFSFSIIEVCDKDKLNDREIFWIKFYDSYNNGYNMNSGGDNSEQSLKFDENFVNNIIKILLETNMSYEEISKKYNISIGRISEINTGKVGNKEGVKYPLRERKKKTYCIKCGKEITKGSQYCTSCFAKQKRKVERPDRETLKDLIRNTPFTQIGKMYNVTDNAVRKWCDSYDLPRKSSVIKTYTEQEWREI